MPARATRSERSRSNEAALTEFGDGIDPNDAVTMHGSIAGLAGWLGEMSGAGEHAEQALEAGRRSGNPSALASALFCYGSTLLHLDPDTARVALEECVASVREGASPVLSGYAVGRLAQLRISAGEHRQGLEDLREALRYAASNGNEVLVRMVCGYAVDPLVKLGQSPEAAAFIGIVGHLMSNELRTEGEEGSDAAALGALVRRLQDDLGDAGFATAVAYGSSLSYDEALTYAQTELDRLIGEIAA